MNGPFDWLRSLLPPRPRLPYGVHDTKLARALAFERSGYGDAIGAQWHWRDLAQSARNVHRAANLERR